MQNTTKRAPKDAQKAVQFCSVKIIEDIRGEVLAMEVATAEKGMREKSAEFFSGRELYVEAEKAEWGSPFK